MVALRFVAMKQAQVVDNFLSSTPSAMVRRLRARAGWMMARTIAALFAADPCRTISQGRYTVRALLDDRDHGYATRCTHFGACRPAVPAAKSVYDWQQCSPTVAG